MTRDKMLIFFMFFSVLLILVNTYLVYQIKEMSNSIIELQSITNQLENEIKSTIQLNQELKSKLELINEKQNSIINRAKNINYKNILILFLATGAIGFGYGCFSATKDISSSFDSFVKILENMIINLGNKVGLKTNVKYDFIDSCGREYQLNIEKSECKLLVKMVDESYLEISEYLFKISNNNPVNNVELTPEIVSIISSGIC